MKYEIRKDGEIKVQFADKSVYTAAQLSAMKADGYDLYIDGKKASERSRKTKEEK